MRKISVFCDKCGKEIKDYPVKIVMEYADREAGELWPDDAEGLPIWTAKQIAEEMRIGVQAVYDSRNKSRKEGKL